MKKVLLTGGMGFIGKNFLNKYKNSYLFFVILRNKKKINRNLIKHKNIKYYFFDNNKFNKNLFKINFDFFINFATHYTKLNDSKNLEKIIDSNIKFPSILLSEINKLHLKKIITIGTMHEHYNNNEFYPYNLYASSKRSLETLLEYFKKKYPNILFYNLKFYESYSDNDQRDKIIPAIKKNYHRNKRVVLSFSNLKLNFLHIDDILEAINIIITRKIKPNSYQIKSRSFSNIKNLIINFNKNKLKKIKIKKIKKKYPIINFRLKSFLLETKNFIEKDFERIINGKN